MEDELIDVICELQGAQLAHSTLLQAMLTTHPDQAALRRAWDSLASPKIAALAQRKAGSLHQEKTAESALYYYRK